LLIRESQFGILDFEKQIDGSKVIDPPEGDPPLEGLFGGFMPLRAVISHRRYGWTMVRGALLAGGDKPPPLLTNPSAPNVGAEFIPA